MVKEERLTTSEVDILIELAKREEKTNVASLASFKKGLIDEDLTDINPKLIPGFKMALVIKRMAPEALDLFLKEKEEEYSVENKGLRDIVTKLAVYKTELT